MTAHRAINIALAIAIAAVLSTGFHLDDHADDWPQSTALQDAQQAAITAQQAQADAIRQCTHLHGPGVAIRYTPDGDLVCIARHGKARTVVAQGGGL